MYIVELCIGIRTICLKETQYYYYTKIICEWIQDQVSVS